MHFPVENSQCLQGIIICGFKCCYFLCQSIRFILLASSLQADCLQNLLTQHRQSCQEHSQELPAKILIPGGESLCPTTSLLLQNFRFYYASNPYGRRGKLSNASCGKQSGFAFLTIHRPLYGISCHSVFPTCRLKTDQSCQFSFFFFFF